MYLTSADDEPSIIGSEIQAMSLVAIGWTCGHYTALWLQATNAGRELHLSRYISYKDFTVIAE